MTKKEIASKRKAIENKLLVMLKETRSDFGLEDIKDIIYQSQPIKFMFSLACYNKLPEDRPH